MLILPLSLREDCVRHSTLVYSFCLNLLSCYLLCFPHQEFRIRTSWKLTSQQSEMPSVTLTNHRSTISQAYSNPRSRNSTLWFLLCNFRISFRTWHRVGAQCVQRSKQLVHTQPHLLLPVFQKLLAKPAWSKLNSSGEWGHLNDPYA